jgi:RHS repeat-associated protein
MTYDRNGNLNKNLHKNVSTITYNHLNLPTVITFTTGNTIEFLYDAAGIKLRKTVKVGATVQYIQDYLPGGIEYRQTGTGVKRVESVFHAEGRYYNTNVDVSSTISWRKEYNFKDHLGNTRLVFTDRNANGIVDITGTASTSDVLQENHYYAFGLAFEGPWLQNDATARDNAYQYNGKELNSDFGLGWTDYGARWYDAGIGRWGQIDPKAEKYISVSPYVYVGNSPIVFWDPNGMEWATDKDKDIAATVKTSLEEREKTLSARALAISKKIEKISTKEFKSQEDKDSQLAKLNGQLENVNAMKSDIGSAISELKELGDSKDFKFTFNELPEGVPEGGTFKNDQNIIQIDYLSESNRIHELKHAYQVLKGDIIAKGGKAGNVFMIPILDTEVAAYRRQYSFSESIPNSAVTKNLTGYSGVAKEYVNGIFYTTNEGRKIYPYGANLFNRN